MEGTQANHPEDKNPGELTPPLICNEVMLLLPSAPPLPPAIVRKAGPKEGHESRRVIPAPSLAVALQRMGPAPHLSNTVELVLTAKAQVSHLEGMRAKELT